MAWTSNAAARVNLGGILPMVEWPQITRNVGWQKCCIGCHGGDLQRSIVLLSTLSEL